jgi:hypothetical protein
MGPRVEIGELAYAGLALLEVPRLQAVVEARLAG